jgi:hypothetical protein
MPKQSVIHVLESATGTTDVSVVAQLCGFDPLELLDSVEFPNDRYERLLRVSKEARMVSIPPSLIHESLNE